MKCFVNVVQNPKFWNIVFKGALILLLIAIFSSLRSISESLENKNVGKSESLVPSTKVEKQEGKKGEMKEEKKEESAQKSESGETQTGSSFWNFWGKLTNTSTGSVVPPVKQDPEQSYTFRCDGGKTLKVFEGKYQLDGQKTSLESGKIALEDSQAGKLHFLTKVWNVSGKAVYEKVVTRLESGKQASYTYQFTTFSNGSASFTKNAKAIYTNCSLAK